MDDEDYSNIINVFEDVNLRLSGHKDEDRLSWIYYTADLTMLNYYFNLYEECKMCKKVVETNTKGGKSTYLNNLKIKYTGLYCKILDQYQDYYHEMAVKYYKTNYRIPKLNDDRHFLYDIMTLNQEILLYDLLALNSTKANAHEKLVFCYKYLVEGWNSKLILDKLRKKKLDKIFINFINEYSKQCGLPQLVPLCYFYPLEEDLHRTATGLTKLNRYFTGIDIKGFLIKNKREKRVYVSDIIEKRVNNIDKWCNRLREKIIRNTIDLLNRE